MLTLETKTLVWLSLDFADVTDGVMISHRIRAGWAGWGRLVDPFFRLYFSRSFAAALDAHVREEFRLLGERLRPGRAKNGSSAFGGDAQPSSPVPERPR